MIQELIIPSFTTYRADCLTELVLSYELAGQALGTSPVVVVCHALTGNSSVAGEEGWWGSLIGQGKAIDTDRHTILAFNIPGNAYDGRELSDPRIFSLRDVARLFLLGIDSLGIEQIDTLIGASLGGAVAWQMAYLAPHLSRRLVVVASDYKASDWLMGQTLVQECILEHSMRPLEDARIHAMLCYRTPESINARFAMASGREEGRRDVVSWLDYHGRKISERFKLSAYKVMTFLTGNIQVCGSPEDLARIESDILIVSIDSDLLFPHHRAVETYKALKRLKDNVGLATIRSPHGHDAFLIDYEQLSQAIAEMRVD